MRIQTLAAAAVLSLAATIPLSTAAFADTHCGDLTDVDAKVQCLKELGQQIDPDKLPELANLSLPERQKHQVHVCDGWVHDLVQDPTPAKLHDDVHERFKDGKPCHHDESDHKRRSHDDLEEKSSHHKKSDDGDSDDNDSSDSDSSDSKADDDSDDDDDTTSTQVKVVPKGSVDTGDGSSL
jgi:hypothetical protein